TCGTAHYGYDLLDRLTSYTSPYKQTATDSGTPATSYALDDGGNITRQITTVGANTVDDETSTFPNGRLATRHSITGTPSAQTIADTNFAYTPLGEEQNRVTTQGVANMVESTTYDPAGHTSLVNYPPGPDPSGTGANQISINYTYDGEDNLLSRQQLNPPNGATSQTTLYFYWGATNILAEEAD